MARRSSSESAPSAAIDHERSGRDADEAVKKAEAGSITEGAHGLGNVAPSGESPVERMADMDEATEGRTEADDGSE